ncbi:hypothetical protein SDC9_204247 [bioreactor metagenome]|uniref:Uncharacterized protein n=1 Tax=bioreactor metagenome TaxID=1076179 RepID=A0A645IZG1_9ZZZZ
MLRLFEILLEQHPDLRIKRDDALNVFAGIEPAGEIAAPDVLSGGQIGGVQFDFRINPVGIAVEDTYFAVKQNLYSLELAELDQRRRIEDIILAFIPGDFIDDGLPHRVVPAFDAGESGFREQRFQPAGDHP